MALSKVCATMPDAPLCQVNDPLPGRTVTVTVMYSAGAVGSAGAVVAVVVGRVVTGVVVTAGGGVLCEVVLDSLGIAGAVAWPRALPGWALAP